MGHVEIFISRYFCRARGIPLDTCPPRRTPVRVRRLVAALLLTGMLLMSGSAQTAEKDSGIIIYTTLDNGRDETAIAVPFTKAEQHALVTNVTTADGKSFRVTNNQLKEIVRPPDLSRLTVVDEAGLRSLKDRAGAFRALQTRFPRAAGALEGTAGEMERLIQVIEGGNVLFEGRVVPRADYERQVAATRFKAIDITLNGRAYTGAKLRSVGDGKVSISHAGGVASIPLHSLSEEAITRLNETSTGPLIARPAEPAQPVAPPAAPLPVATASTKPQVSQPPTPLVTVTATTPPDRPTDTPIQPPVPPTAPAQSAPSAPSATPPRTPITLTALRTLLRECERHVQIQREGHAALADLQTFPGGRYGSMKYEQAMQESRAQQARLDTAVSEQKPLRDKLRLIGTSSPDDSRVSEPLRERLRHFASLPDDTVEDLTGILWLGGELASLLKELEKVAPETTMPTTGANVPDPGSAPTTATIPGQTGSPFLTLPRRGLPPVPFIVAGLLAFAATGGAFLLQRHRERSAACSCPRCQSRKSGSHYTDRESITCSVCDHEYVAITPPCGTSPGPLVYGGVATGSLLLLVGLFIQVEHATATPTDHSGYTLSDYPADLHFLREKAESGDPSAQYELGRFHDRGTDDFPADPREAALWYLSAAEAGDPTAQLAIGTLYDMGHGIAPDPEQAERWLTAAAEQGVVEAQKILGVLYLGKGSLPYEPERSIQWMTRAAEQGDGEAMFHLSVAYHKGVEVAPDPEMSERWLERSVEAGFGPAKEIVRLRQANLEAQIDDMWQKTLKSMPASPGPYANPYTQNIPPQYR